MYKYVFEQTSLNFALATLLVQTESHSEFPYQVISVLSSLIQLQLLTKQ